jgi:hypothetical protein
VKEKSLLMQALAFSGFARRAHGAEPTCPGFVQGPGRLTTETNQPITSPFISPVLVKAPSSRRDLRGRLDVEAETDVLVFDDGVEQSRGSGGRTSVAVNVAAWRLTNSSQLPAPPRDVFGSRSVRLGHRVEFRNVRRSTAVPSERPPPSLRNPGPNPRSEVSFSRDSGRAIARSVLFGELRVQPFNRDSGSRDHRRNRLGQPLQVERLGHYDRPRIA